MKKKRRIVQTLAFVTAVVFSVTSIDAITGLGMTYAEAAAQAHYDISLDAGKKRIM